MTSCRGAVAAGHDLVVGTVCDVLDAGGNAVDAAIAAMAMACVAEPVLTSFGGGGFALVLPADGKPRVYDFFAQAPGRHPPDPDGLDFYPVQIRFESETQEFHIGWGTAAVPGMAAGMYALHQDFARMPVRDLIAPAIDHAKRGVPLNAEQSFFFSLVEPIILATDDSRALFASESDPSRAATEGQTIRQPDFADFLDAMGHEGPDLFYRGEAARALTDTTREAGCLNAEDLESYRVERRRPLEARCGGAEILLNPPPAAGGILVAFALAMLEETEPKRLAPSSHWRARILADALWATDGAKVEGVCEMGEGGGPHLRPDLVDAWRQKVRPLAPAYAGTTHVSIIDGEGGVAAVTVSNGSGSGCVIPGTGIVVNNMLGEADLNPGGFHRWPEGRRLTSMMAPSVARWPDGQLAVTGSGGSSRIRSAVLQVLVNLACCETSVEEAVLAPRLHVEDGHLSLEPGFDGGGMADLLAEWPRHQRWEAPSMFFGGAHTVRLDRGAVEAVGDPRRGGAARVL